MKILIGIPTFKRHVKLHKCLDSVFNSTYKNIEVVVCCDNNDNSSVDYLKEQYFKDGKNPFYDIIVQDSQKFVIGAWNRIVSENIATIQRDYNINPPIEEHFGAFLGLCDDIELWPDAIEQSVNRMKTMYPDTDGVIGFNQVCPGRPDYTFKWFGQTLMGRKFIERYKLVDYQICCPAYKHFYQDAEMYEYTKSMGKFFECEHAIMNHLHPSFIGNIDEAHNNIRFGENSPKKHDDQMFERRQKLGLIWGKSFSL